VTPQIRKQRPSLLVMLSTVDNEVGWQLSFAKLAALVEAARRR
jgi:hypothetical protein